MNLDNFLLYLSFPKTFKTGVFKKTFGIHTSRSKCEFADCTRPVIYAVGTWKKPENLIFTPSPKFTCSSRQKIRLIKFYLNSLHAPNAAWNQLFTPLFGTFQFWGESFESFFKFYELFTRDLNEDLAPFGAKNTRLIISHIASQLKTAKSAKFRRTTRCFLVFEFGTDDEIVFSAVVIWNIIA